MYIALIFLINNFSLFDFMFLLTAVVPWTVMMILAIIIGAVRQKYILPKTGEQKAHIIGTLIFLLLQFLIIHIYVSVYCIYQTDLLLMTGVFWIGLAVFFEFIFGHYVMKHSWNKLLADYNIFKGRLWLLVLINNLAATLISGKLLQ